MQIQSAIRKQVKMRLGITGPSGSGRTLGALRTAFGLCGDWTKVAIIDTCYGAASLHSAEGPFNTIGLKAPYDPEAFINALILCEEKGMEAVIIDNLSDAWMGAGGVVDLYCASCFGRTERPSPILQMHHELLRTLSESTCHIIVTLRKDRLKGEIVQDEMLLDHLHTILELDREHLAKTVKDRTGLFEAADPFSLKPETGAALLQWCNRQAVMVPESLQKSIDSCLNMKELYQLLFTTEASEPEIMYAFVRRRLQLQGFIEDGVSPFRQVEVQDRKATASVISLDSNPLTSA